MKAQITGLRVASVVFALAMCVQAARIVVRPEVVVAGHLVPLWPSVVAVVVLAGLSLWMWELAAGKPDSGG
jgi:hypothetical protein